jgi:hypothetical protein
MPVSQLVPRRLSRKGLHSFQEPVYHRSLLRNVQSRFQPFGDSLISTGHAANASRAAGKKSNILLIWVDDNGKRWEVSQNACD